MRSIADLPSERRSRELIDKILLPGLCCPVRSCSRTLTRGSNYYWCGSCRKKIRPRAHTWLHKTKLSSRQILVLLWCWQHRQSPQTARLTAHVSYETVKRWYTKLRTQLPDANTGLLLDGIVEIDESFFGKRRYGHQTIVVGAIERDSRNLKLEIIEDREQDTLELFITRHIARSSLLLTDCHRGYSDLAFYGYRHERYNHSLGHFSETNQIENTWGVIKRYMRKLYGCIPTKNLQSILNEWMARHNSPWLFDSPINYLQATLCSV